MISIYYICSGEKPIIMDDLLKKLSFKSHERIAVINAPAGFEKRIASLAPEVQIDTEINARYLYEFMIAFTTGSKEVNELGPACIHNLSEDGRLWLAYPKGQSKKAPTDINRDHGWEPLEKAGFRRVSQIAIDEKWSALRFRNARYVKPTKS